jgi:hypothetical protein
MKKIFLIAFLSIIIVACSTTTTIKYSNTNDSKNSNGIYDISNFCSTGFGFKYNQNEIFSMKEFIKYHGKPISQQNSDYINNHDLIKDVKTILYYQNYEIGYLNYSKRTKWNPPESMLMYISSVKKGKYENGVAIGDMMEKTANDLKVISKNSNEIEYSNNLGNTVLLLFENNRLSKIIWEYGGE